MEKQEVSGHDFSGANKACKMTWASGRWAGGPGLTGVLSSCGVPPVPRLWGPGRLRRRTGDSASTRAVASLSAWLSIPIRSPRFRVCLFDSAQSSTTSNPPASLPVLDGFHSLQRYSDSESVGRGKCCQRVCPTNDELRASSFRALCLRVGNRGLQPATSN